MKFLFILLFSWVIIWEVLKFPILTSSWISLVDISIILLSFFWWIKYIFKEKDFFVYKWFWVFTVFLLIWFSSLLINSQEMVLNFWEFSQSFFYFLRYFLFWNLIFLSFNFAKNDNENILIDDEKNIWDEKKFLDNQNIFFNKNKIFLINLIFLSAFIIFILWFLQMKFFWNFYKMWMQDLWWDPHIWRMLSTWFDPNFLSWYFAFVSSLAIWIIRESYYKYKKIRYFLIWLVFCLIVWIILSYSRSWLLAFLVSAWILWLFLSRKLLIVFAIIFVLWIWASDRAQERFLDWVESAKNIFLWTWTLDPTAKLRVKSWETWIELFNEKPFIWRWFNTLKLVQKEKWAFMTKSHWASWIDASFITVLATTWILWFLFFIFFIFQILFFNLKNFLKNKDGFAIWLFAWLIWILIHAVFVNMLFFYLFLPVLFVAVWVGFVEWEKID